MSRILIADDEHAICEAFARMLRLDGHEALIAANGREALRLVDECRPDAAFIDVRMPGMDGLACLAEIRKRHPELPVVVMTAYGTMETALSAMRQGAFDYLGKPLELKRIRELLGRALHRPEPAAGCAEPDTGAGEEGRLIGRSAPMQELFKLMVLVTENDLTVLILGESGSGKELVARGIHGHGPRRELPFVALNCAAIPENLIESELFGHEKGAFSGAHERRVGRIEAAAGGTLFLDEIAELPPHLQGKLLRVLQERSFERVGSNRSLPMTARIIAATNRDLAGAVADGWFREDLYHRLNLVTLRVPPLRKRSEDIPILAAHFLRQAARQLNRELDGIESAAIQRLRAYDWPGNVRELEHLIKRSALVARGPTLTVHDLDLPMVEPEQGSEPGQDDGESGLARAARSALHGLLETAGEGAPPSDLYHRLVGLVERELVAEALRITGDNQVAASRLLSLHRTTLRKKIEMAGDPDEPPTGG